MVVGTLKVFNFGSREFDLAFSQADEKDLHIYRVPGIDRLASLSKTLGVVFTPEELGALRRGEHLSKECELREADLRTFFK